MDAEQVVAQAVARYAETVGETDLRDALTRPEPFYAISQPKGTPAHV